ncbi:hypothetical protein OIU76_029613 [Salix suchowensis]|nr:hypothetical protein OIU76_029613 [Salix suchowensis]
MGPPNNNGQEYHTLNHSRRLCNSVSAKHVREGCKRSQAISLAPFGGGLALISLPTSLPLMLLVDAGMFLQYNVLLHASGRVVRVNPTVISLWLARRRFVTSSCSPEGTIGNPCGGNSTNTVRMPMCLDVNGAFNYGIYKWALPVISSNSLAVKILYPIFWGLLTLSTFGNDLEPTSHWLEVIFSICIVLSGLMLFTLLIGNIQVFLHAVMAKKRKMQLRCRDMEWWMRRRQLPSCLRQRVRHFEQQRWETMGGEDEMELIKDLPEGLRRDVKRYLCLDLIKKVPLFHNLDDLILDNICDRVIPIVFSRDEKIIREGDPVQRMVFIVHGRIRSSQSLSKGMVATSVLEPGGFPRG